jgi:3-phenylpropionate/cinnamic acid dioxygenase small subunit
MTLAAADRLALSDLVHRYAAGVDDREFDSVTALFVDFGRLVTPDPPRSLEPVTTHEGRTAIAGAVAAVAAVQRTRHAIVGEVYSAGSEPGYASGRIACVAHHWNSRDEHVTDVVWHLRYDDEYVLTDGGWRFVSRTLTIDAIEARPVRRLRQT